MEAKLFEVRDKGTFMPVLAVLLEVGANTPQDEYLLRRSGFAYGERYILMTPIYSHPDKSTTDPYDWGDRTRHTAHKHIIEAWYALKSGDVIDVEYLLGETSTKKESEKGKMP